MVRGEGAYVWDDQGRRYLDGLAGLFVVQAGHGRKELAAAAARQAEELAFFPIWSYAHPRAIELAERLAHYAPGDLNRVQLPHPEIFAALEPGATLLVNDGKGASQTVPHVHLHVVPRHGGDGIALSWPRKEPGAEVLRGYAERLRAVLVTA